MVGPNKALSAVASASPWTPPRPTSAVPDTEVVTSSIFPQPDNAVDVSSFFMPQQQLQQPQPQQQQPSWYLPPDDLLSEPFRQQLLPSSPTPWFLQQPVQPELLLPQFQQRRPTVLPWLNSAQLWEPKMHGEAEPQPVESTQPTAPPPPPPTPALPKFELFPENMQVVFAPSVYNSRFPEARSPQRPKLQSTSIERVQFPPVAATLPPPRITAKKPLDFWDFTFPRIAPPISASRYVVRHAVPVYEVLTSSAATLGTNHLVSTSAFTSASVGPIPSSSPSFASSSTSGSSGSSSSNSSVGTRVSDSVAVAVAGAAAVAVTPVAKNTTAVSISSPSLSSLVYHVFREPRELPTSALMPNKSQASAWTSPKKKMFSPPSALTGRTLMSPLGDFET